jgi:hypothetical protein
MTDKETEYLSLQEHTDILAEKEKKIAALEEALEFYANTSSWGCVETYDGYIDYGAISTVDIEDKSGGKRAREALAKLRADTQGEK